MQQLGAWSRALRLEWISSHRSHGQNQISHMTPGRNSPVTHSQGFQSGHAAPLQPDTRDRCKHPFPSACHKLGCSALSGNLFP